MTTYEQFANLEGQAAYDKFEQLCVSRANIAGTFCSWREIPEAVVREVRLEHPTLAIAARRYLQSAYPEMVQKDPIWRF